MIVKGTRPRIFTKFSSPRPYVAQKRAWSTRALMRRWRDKVFTPRIRNTHRLTGPVQLLMDGFRGHSLGGESLSASDSFITTKIFPPNCTACFQPARQGIIAALKRRYKYELLSRIPRCVSAVGYDKRAKIGKATCR